MTIKETIKEFQTQIETFESMILYNKDFDSKSDNTRLEKRMEAAKMAVSALEKQIPKKPIKSPSCSKCKKEDCTSDCLSHEYGGSTILCSNCKDWVVRNRNNGDCYTDKYCPNCGQAIDWSENQKE